MTLTLEHWAKATIFVIFTINRETSETESGEEEKKEARVKLTLV